MDDRRNFYSNPAFCQQSEFYNNRICRSPPRVKSPGQRAGDVRQSPLGAHSPQRHTDAALPPKPGPKPAIPKEDYQEQEFYEEILVDETGLITQKNIVVVASQDDKKSRYAYLPDANNSTQRSYTQKHRYEYIPMTEHDAQPKGIPIPRNNPRLQEEEIEFENGRVHRYAIIPMEEETDLTYEQNPPNRKLRYEYISPPRSYTPAQYLPQEQKKPNVATQKLFEILTTPKKSPSKKFIAQQSPRKFLSTPKTPSQRDPFVTPNTSPAKVVPRARQNLYYGPEKKHTAVIQPICSSPYTETTYSNKSGSWMNVSSGKQPVQTTLTVASIMLILCGSLAAALCFYMISIMGRLYFLDFGIVSGFSCLLLGILGFRSRTFYYWLPNRNYMSGYIILTLFSLMTCVGLLVLLFMQPKPGSPWADMTSGAVCGVSVLSLILASAGVFSTYCCKFPPPDNRVQHCVRGFTV